ncbi:MAG: DUF1302 family protein [Campylobacterales bacterium]|nr:DUF1302 family protein [Campylobacterales bacterium]
MLRRLLLFTLLVTSHIDANEMSDDLAGFDDIEVVDTPQMSSETQETLSPLTLSGQLKFKTSYGYKEHQVDGVEYSGFNQAQSSLYLQIDYKFAPNWSLRASGNTFYDAVYSLHDKPYNQDVLDTYETQLRFDDVYIQGELTQNLDLKLGRQIVVWGKSDSIRITDVINPLDNRLPAITDIKNLRLSTSMAKLDYYSGAWNLSAMAIFESRIFLEPAVRGEFFPVDAIFPNAPDPFIELNEPKSSLETPQYAFAANGIFSGWDISFYGAHVYDSRWHLKGSLPNATREVSKIYMFGSAFNIVYESWLFKSEIAYLDSLKYNSTANEKARLDALIGFDYNGFKDTLISVEVANRHLFSYEEQMSGFTMGFVPDYTQEDEVQTAIRVNRSFSNDTIDVTILANLLGHHWQYGGFIRASLEYELFDSTLVEFGAIDYLKPAIVEEKPFSDSISNNDRIFAEISYSF